MLWNPILKQMDIKELLLAVLEIEYAKENSPLMVLNIICISTMDPITFTVARLDMINAFGKYCQLMIQMNHQLNSSCFPRTEKKDIPEISQ